jgi:hypothetical protein
MNRLIKYFQIIVAILCIMTYAASSSIYGLLKLPLYAHIALLVSLIYVVITFILWSSHKKIDIQQSVLTPKYLLDKSRRNPFADNRYCIYGILITTAFFELFKLLIHIKTSINDVNLFVSIFSDFFLIIILSFIALMLFNNFGVFKKDGFFNGIFVSILLIVFVELFPL